MSNTTQLRTQDRFGQTYADPADPDFTVRFKTTSGRKSMNGINVDNFITEIIINDINQVAVGDRHADEAIAVRLRVSGSNLSHARLQAIVNQLASELPSYGTGNVFLGFNPTTPPVNPQ